MLQYSGRSLLGISGWSQLLTKLASRIRWGGAIGDGSGNHNPGETGSQHIGQVLQRDAANRKAWQLDRGLNLFQKGGSWIGIELFRLAGICRATTEVVSSILDSLLSLLQRVSGDADQRRWSHNLPGRGHRQFLLADMHAIGCSGAGDVGPIVDNQQWRVTAAGSYFIQRVTHHQGAAEQIAIIQLLVPQLEHVDAGSCQGTGSVSKLVVAVAAIDDNVQASIGQQGI
jgi:hypothetical protein